MTQFIVAEISKNWRDGSELVQNGLACQLFERCIEHNRLRGYRLHSFQLHRMMTGDRELNETIIAVFERVDAKTYRPDHNGECLNCDEPLEAHQCPPESLP